MAELRKDYSVFHPNVEAFELDSNDWIETLELFFIPLLFLNLLFGFFRFPAQKCQVIKEKERGIADY